MEALINYWKKYWFIWLGTGIILIAAGIFISLSKPYSFHGTVINPPKQAPNFSLLDTKGSTFRLSDYKGKIVLLFFGYTNCPDECPATLAIMKQVWANLGNKVDQIKFVFITVDPERDTGPVLQSFIDKFNSDFIGLTGSESEMKPVWNSFGVYVTKSGTGPDYSVSHSLNLYLVDKKGDVAVIYPYPTTVEDLSKDLFHLVD